MADAQDDVLQRLAIARAQLEVSENQKRVVAEASAKLKDGEISYRKYKQLTQPVLEAIATKQRGDALGAGVRHEGVAPPSAISDGHPRPLQTAARGWLYALAGMLAVGAVIALAGGGSDSSCSQLWAAREDVNAEMRQLSSLNDSGSAYAAASEEARDLTRQIWALEGCYGP